MGAAGPSQPHTPRLWPSAGEHRRVMGVMLVTCPQQVSVDYRGALGPVLGTGDTGHPAVALLVASQTPWAMPPPQVLGPGLILCVSPQDSGEWLGASRCEQGCFVTTSPSPMLPRLHRSKDAVPMTLCPVIFLIKSAGDRASDALQMFRD